MPRARDIGIRIGAMPTGPTNSVLDVTGVGLGHTTLFRDEPAPPAGRGVARTGVTALLLAEDAYLRPLSVGGAVLNGAGECTGFLTAGEWGLVETPVYLTSTMQLGRVYDAACEIELERRPQVADEVVIPVVAECDDSFLNDCRRMQVSRRRRPGGVRRRARLAWPARPTAGGSGRVRHRDVVPGVQGRHRHLVTGDARGSRGRRAADDQLRPTRPPDRRRRTRRPARRPCTGAQRPAGWFLHRRGGHGRAGGLGRLRPAGPADRAGSRADGVHRAPRQRRDLPRRQHDCTGRSGRSTRARGTAGRPSARRALRGRRRRRRGVGAELAPGCPHDGGARREHQRGPGPGHGPTSCWRRAVPGTEQSVRIAMADGVELAATLVPARGRHRRRAATLPARGAPLPQGRPDLVVRRAVPQPA